MRVYLDSCIIIYFTEGGADMQERIGRRLLSTEGNGPSIVFTDLSRLECRVKPLATGDSAVLTDYDDFFAMPGFEKFGLDTVTFDVATDLRARHRLKTPDALHLAAALSAKCDELWTNDERLGRAAGDRIRIVTIDQFT